MRIANSEIFKDKKWKGYTASMRNYFYGVKVQLLTTKDGIPISFHFTSGKTGDAKALGKMIEKLSPKASLNRDSAYTAYGLEECFGEKMHLFKDSTQVKC